MEKPRFSVSEFIAFTNQTLEYAYPSIEVEGEVSSFKVNQGKFVFFDLKDASGTVNCFMMVFQLRLPIEEGMKVIVTATPKLTTWGRFSLTVRTVRPSGEGSLRKSFELLKASLQKEGLFDQARKRQLPDMPRRVAVITSAQSAGYADFVKIINTRWGGMKVEVGHVQVQGDSAPDQIIRAINYFNQQPELAEALVLIRGGGSADDLMAFNDEKLVRALAASRIPTLVGVGHEIDTTLCDLVADRRASTPSNAAELLVPDRREMIRLAYSQVASLLPRLEQAAHDVQRQSKSQLGEALRQIDYGWQRADSDLQSLRAVLRQLDPDAVLRRGYSLLRGQPIVGGQIEIETDQVIIKAEVKNVKKR